MQKRALLFLVFLDLLGFGLILPVLPFAAQTFGASAWKIGLLAAIFPFFQSLTVPLWGKLSDSWGRRPVLLLSALGALFAYLFFAFAQSLLLLFVSRAIAGIMAANLGVAKAYIADLSTEKNLSQNMGLYAAAQALGFLLGPALGAALGAYGLRGIGLTASAFSLCSLLMLCFLKESLSEKLRAKKKDPLLVVLRNNPNLLTASLAFFLVTLGFSHLFVAFPLYTQEAFGYGAKETAYFFVLLSFLGILVQGILFGKLAKRFSESILLEYGLAIMALSLLIFPPWQSFAGAILLVVFVAIGYSLANPALLSLVSRAARKEEQGAAAGISEACGGAARVLGPIVAGATIKNGSTKFAFLSAAFFTGIALLERLWEKRSGLRASLAPAQKLTLSRREEMFALFQRYYQDVTLERFLEDFEKKNYVLLFWETDQGVRKLVGFSTILVKKENENCITLFSGDTVLEEKYWGSRILQKSFARFLMRTKIRRPGKKVYWLLMSKGYKTYLLMRKNFPISYPNHQAETPQNVLEIKRNFYRQMFGKHYEEERSRIRFTEPHGAVRGSIASPNAHALESAEVQFFLQRNPEYKKGDELACIAEIRLRDILYVLLKYVLVLTGRRG